VPLAPVAGAAAPAIAIGQAIGRCGNWFNQELYGRPSGLPWAVQISPAHRLPGYESFATFQPAFLYEAMWDLLVAAAVIWATRRFLLTGDRAFALYVAAFSVGMFAVQAIRIDPAHHVLGLRVNQWVAVLGCAAAAGYLYRTRRSRAAMPAPALRPALAAPTAPAPVEGTAASAGPRAESAGGRGAAAAPDPAAGSGAEPGAGPGRGYAPGQAGRPGRPGPGS
jgi:hypothetical protein